MKKTTISILTVLWMATQAFSQGAYIEFKIGGSQSGITGTAKSYTKDGNSRSEIHMVAPQVPGAAIDKVTLILKGNTKKAYTLNENAKTYTEMDLIGAAAPDEDPTQYEVTLIGKEKVNGYNSTHVKLKKKTQTAEEDVWVSTEVLNYKQYLSVKSKYTSAGIFKAIQAKGAEGFIVRVMASERGHSMQVDLVKSELRNNDASLFSLDGYKKESAIAAGAESAAQDVMQKMQNMTPEERQQFIEALRSQHPSPPPTPPH
jgi:hypothetical protein